MEDGGLPTLSIVFNDDSQDPSKTPYEATNPNNNDDLHSSADSSFYAPSSTRLQWPTRMGRDSECEIIAKAILAVKETSKPHILHIHGASGTGKSTAIQLAYDLALQRLDMDTESAGIAWVSGKYDEQLEGARPFSAILDAVTDLYGNLSESTIQAIEKEFTSDELTDLSAVIPLPTTLKASGVANLTSMQQQSHLEAFDDLTNPAATKTAQADDISVGKNDSNQFRTFLRLFRRMMELICNQYSCVAIVLDDVQWSDDVSLELLESVLSNDKLTNFLFVAAQRTGSDEPKFNMPETSFPITTLEIAPLDEQQVHQLIAAALTMSVDETADLANVVHRRAGGNTLFAVQFVELLCAKQLIVSDGSGQYQWDLDTIASKTQSTSNVADILVKKLTSLPFEIQLALIIAAHIGFRFKGKVLLELLENTELVNLFAATANHSFALDRYVTTLYSGLEQAKKTGLVEKLHATDEYRFAHDRVQKSARGLLPKGKTGDKILAKLGLLLLDRIEAQEAEHWMVFAATKLLTKHASSDVVSKPRMARLCLRAATIARSQSAYRQSAKYAETGCNKLGKSGWTNEYQLILKLSCIAAEMYFAAGNMDTSRNMVTKMEDHTVCVEHCFRAYNVLEEILGAQCDYEGCVTESRKRLALLGVTLPKKPGQGAVLTNLIKTKALLKGRSAKDLENLPPMTDEKKMQAIRMLGHVGEAYWHIGDGDGCACTCLIMLQVVLKHGVCGEGVYAFPAYAVCLGHLGDIKECAAFFNLGRKLSEKDDIALSITSATEHNMGHFLSHELASSPHDLMRASEASARIGDIYRAGFNLRDVCPIGVFAGFRLKELEERINYCDEFFKDYKQNGAWEYMLPWLQFAECMRGKTDDYEVLSGTFVDQDKIMDLIKDRSKLETAHRVMVLAWHYCQNFVLLLHNMPEKIIEEKKRFKHIPEEMGPNYQKIINCFNSALAYYSLAPEKRAYKGKARNYARVVKKHSIAGSPMLKSMCIVIEAEEAALLKQKDKALSLYEEAVREFGRQSMYLYKALTLERAARFATVMDDKATAQRFFQDSYQEYEMYGAEAKIEAMRKVHPKSNFPSPVPESVLCQEAEDSESLGV